MHELPWITIFGSRVRRFANDFHEWRSHEYHWQIASRVTPKSLFTVTNILFYFLHAVLCPRTHTSAKKTSSIAHFATVAKDGLFWLRIVTSPQLICDVTRTRILALWRHICRLFLHVQIGAKATSLVNNNREYRFLTTRYSRPSV